MYAEELGDLGPTALAIELDAPRMRADDLVERQETWLDGLLGEALVKAPEFLIGACHRRLELVAAIALAHRRNEQ